jgi:hypothetical protein
MMTTPIIKSDVAMGRRMKSSEKFMAARRQPRLLQFLARLVSAFLHRFGVPRWSEDDLGSGLQFVLAVDNHLLAGLEAA